jgi:hypothetical protein
MVGVCTFFYIRYKKNKKENDLLYKSIKNRTMTYELRFTPDQGDIHSYLVAFTAFRIRHLLSCIKTDRAR